MELVYSEYLGAKAVSTTYFSFQTLSFSGYLRGGGIIISKNSHNILTRFCKNIYREIAYLRKEIPLHLCKPPQLHQFVKLTAVINNSVFPSGKHLYILGQDSPLIKKSIVFPGQILIWYN